MNRPGFVFLLWGLELAALVAIGFAFGFKGVAPALLLGGAALTFVLLGAYLAARRLGAVDGADLLVAPDLSPATAWLGVAIVLLAASATLGLWLTFIGAGMAVAGVAGLARELRAQRQLSERVLGEGGED